VRVLVAADECALGYTAAAALRGAGLHVDVVGDLPGVDKAVVAFRYGCVIFDQRLPSGESSTYVESRRRDGWPMPVLILSSRRHGGANYLVSPFTTGELVARVLGLRCQPAVTDRPAPDRPALAVGEVEIDLRQRRVLRDGAAVTVTAKEFAVLEYLVAHSGEVVSRRRLIEHCWDAVAAPASNVVDVMVAQLRRKLGMSTAIRTVRGVGYLFDERPVPALHRVP
jgi:DNA-binding response OmpR family regulator